MVFYKLGTVNLGSLFCKNEIWYKAISKTNTIKIHIIFAINIKLVENYYLKIILPNLAKLLE